MRRQRWWMPLLALVFATSFEPTLTLPVRDEELDTSTKLLGSSVVTSVSVVTGSSDDGVEISSSNADRSRVIPSKELPASPADLLRPDRFQFYTLNQDGHVVTKQMTEREIQSLIAAGGGQLPVDDQQPQNAGDVPTGGMKVADVVENVQKVLKSEMNKFSPSMTAMPTIPGHANTEWSSILPAIFGGEPDNVGVSDPTSATLTDGADTTIVKIPESTGAQTIVTMSPVDEPSTTAHYEINEKPAFMTTITVPQTEKPMIQVPVITVDQKLPTHQDEGNSTPIFQMLDTISADKINPNNDAQSHPDESKIVEPQKMHPSEPIGEESGLIQSSSNDETKIPDMMNKISSSEKLSTKKPVSTMTSAVTASEESQTEGPAIVSVISETHSTSMKISGHEEVPLREPAKPVDRIESPPAQTKPEVTEKSPANISTDMKLDSPTMKTTSDEPSVTPAPVATDVTSEKPGLFAQGVTFLENLPQAVSTIVTDFMYSNSSQSKPTVEKIQPISTEKTQSVQLDAAAETEVSSKKPQTVETIIPSKKPDEEPVYQMMPEIIPDNKMPIHDASSPSEATSIEQIMEALNDPSVPSTVPTDRPSTQTSPIKIAPAVAIPTSTAATSTNAEISNEPSSGKPVEPLPTELADSLSSMISQISDAMPSVLPVGQDAGLDTTGKKNVVDMLAEEPATNDTKKIDTKEILTTSANPSVEIKLTTSIEPEKTAITDANPSKIEETTVAHADVTQTTEIIEQSFSTTYVTSSTTESTSPHSSSTKMDLSLIENVTTQVPDVSTDKIDVPVAEKLEVPMTNPDKSNVDADAMIASSETATEKILPAVTTQQSVVDDDVTKSAITDATPINNTPMEELATTVVSSAEPVATTILSDSNDATPAKVQADVLLTSAPAASIPENQQTLTSMDIGSNENNTEMPIVHIAITESKPTNVENSNKSQAIKIEDSRPESPVVRIQLTDPITLINNMIQSANVSATAGPVEPLILPESGSVPPNNIASGLIAGFPSSTQATPQAATIVVDSIKSQPEIQLANNATFTEVNADSNTSEVQHVNITKTSTTETPKLSTEEIVAADKIEVVETTTLKNIPSAESETTLQPVVADEPQKDTTSKADTTEKSTTDKVESIDSIVLNNTANVEATSIPLAAENATSDLNSLEIRENVTMVSHEATTQMSTLVTSKIIENATTTASMPIPMKSESAEKKNKLSEVVEMIVDTSAKPDVTEGPTVILEDKIATAIPVAPEKLETPKNSTMSEVPVVRIDVESETEFEKMPSKIQPTSLPMVEMNEEPMNPMPVKTIETQTSESATTSSTSDESTRITEFTSPSTTTSKFIEVTAENVEDDKPKPEDAVMESVKPVSDESSVSMESVKPVSDKNSVSMEKLATTTAPMSTIQQTEQIRIRVNDTAVLVTKRPVSEASGQTPGNLQNTTANQSVDEQPTTSEASPITASLPIEVNEKVERLPVPVKVSELSSNKDAAPLNPLTKIETINLPENKNSTMSEVSSITQTTTVKIDNDSMKPIQQTNASNSLQSSADPVMATASSTENPSSISDEILVHGDNDSHAEPSIKVEIMTSTTLEDSSETTSTMSSSSKPVNKPAEKSEEKTTVAVTDRPYTTTGKPASEPTMNIKKNETAAEAAEEKWTLIPQHVYPAVEKTSGAPEPPATTEEPSTTTDRPKIDVTSNRRPSVPLDHRQSVSGLDSTVKNLDPNISSFADLCNELAFRFWTATNKSLSQSRSLAVSPFGMTSLLAMVFLSAREPTSSHMNNVLKLDDNVSFNPHLVFQNITDAVRLARNEGVANAAFVRELFVDRTKVRGLMPFYKRQAQHFYDGIVEEANFTMISELVRKRTNERISEQTGGRIDGFMSNTAVPLRSPLAAMSANVFQTNCKDRAASSEGRDGEIYFAVSPAARQRKLVPVPATVWKSGVLGGYVTSLDATAVALGGADKLVSTIFVIPGNQGHTAPGDSLDRLEQRFIKGATDDDAWKNLLKVLIPRSGLELQVPKFSHRSVINATAALKRMGLKELFSKHANLKAIKSVRPDVNFGDIFQMNLFSTCGDENIEGGRHHVEVYPNNQQRNARGNRDFEDEETNESFDDSINDEEFTGSTYDDAPQRQARWDRQQNDTTEKTRVKLDRPFLYFVRHNPTGLILHMGRFNPRLLPSGNSVGDAPVKTTSPSLSTMSFFKRDRSKSRD